MDLKLYIFICIFGLKLGSQFEKPTKLTSEVVSWLQGYMSLEITTYLNDLYLMGLNFCFSCCCFFSFLNNLQSTSTDFYIQSVFSVTVQSLLSFWLYITYTLIGHFVRYTLQVLGFTHFCLLRCFDSSGNTPQRFWFILT